ncbi:putative mediator of RNA polymerase II transcription subunit 26 [Drosophila eugracilis]|uniref:putative mediator of RNA polymerase II transcription subunit 26 n=1 Tax=Drosophila eugracilis TaxID=29029 RepID=UPI0007E77A33|nr:putative mediator of RNA polymerase II transcription subunit 26 [Drosophila eugracilis]
MVVSESESEFVPESEPQPKKKQQEATEGNLLITHAHDTEVEVNPDSEEERENKPKDLEKNQEDISSSTREDTTRPLVLEERHSLSIAETKKRRACVFTNELLFIPKELARSELQQRTRTLSRYTKNRDYHLRMLKYPVGSGRARYLAKQMKQARHSTSKERDNQSETIECTASIKQEEFKDEESQNSNELPLSMPDLGGESGDKNQLTADNEMSIFLFDFVKKEAETNKDLEEINRKYLQSQRESVIRTSSTKRHHYPYLSWHNPEREVKNIKREFVEQWNSKEKPDIQEGYCETNDISPTECKQEFTGIEEQAQEYIQEFGNPEQIEEPPDIKPQLEQPATISYFCPSSQVTHEIEQQVTEMPANIITPITSGSPEDPGQTALRQQLMHHIVQPNFHNEEVYNSINCNNNAIDRVNQNLREHQFVEVSVANEPTLQWNPQNVVNYTNESFHNQQLQIQQQYLQQQLNYSSNHQQQEIIYQQHQHEAGDKLQQMRVMYQEVKCREKEQMHQLSNSLKKILDERMTCERQHAEENRLFLLKIEHFKKVEAKLKLDKVQLQRQLRSDLRTLELRIADLQRQQEEKAYTYSWQQYQQQNQQQPQQQHFMHHPNGLENQANSEPYMMQQHSFLYNTPPYTSIYPTSYQESIVYQQSTNAYRNQHYYPAAQSQTTAVDLQRRLLLPPPPYSQSNRRTSTEVSSTSRKVKHRHLTANQTLDPYPAPMRGCPLPPAAEILQLQRNPQIIPSATQAHEPRNADLGITPVMATYVANFMNSRADR